MPVPAFFETPQSSLLHLFLGKGIDEVGMTEEFQKMLEQASKLGTLDRAFGMETIR